LRYPRPLFLTAPTARLAFCTRRPTPRNALRLRATSCARCQRTPKP
jgi:hypothetical protein